MVVCTHTHKTEFLFSRHYFLAYLDERKKRMWIQFSHEFCWQLLSLLVISIAHPSAAENNNNLIRY